MLTQENTLLLWQPNGTAASMMKARKIVMILNPKKNSLTWKPRLQLNIGRKELIPGDCLFLIWHFLSRQSIQSVYMVHGYMIKDIVVIPKFIPQKKYGGGEQIFVIQQYIIAMLYAMLPNVFGGETKWMTEQN